MKKVQFFILIILLLFSVQKSYSYDAQIEYDEVYIDYKSLDYTHWKKEGNDNLYLAKNAKTYKDKMKYYGRAAGSYETIAKISPASAENMATLGHIYGKMHQRDLAISYLDRGLNLSIKSPIVNNYYGIFFQDEREYRNALWYYKIAYNNGMANDYSLNYNLANVYAKLGDLGYAKQHYQKAYSLKPSKELKNRIRQMDDLKKR